jgi:hypothetical protein
MFMPRKLLNGPDIITLLQQMCRKTVPKRVVADMFIQPYQTTCLTDSSLQAALMHMMPTFDS